MMAMATMRLKLTMIDARLKVDRPTFSRSCAIEASHTTRLVRGAALRMRTVNTGTSNTAPNSRAAMAP